MILCRRLRAALVAGAICCTGAAAYENENAVPLALTGQLHGVGLERVAVRLDGRDVTIAMELVNDTGRRQDVAFYAGTPLFARPGIGEEYADKRFLELAVTIQGRPEPLRAFPRAYFHGRDVTARLLRAGIDPLPDGDVDGRRRRRLPVPIRDAPDDWLGGVTYAWHFSLPAGSRKRQQVRYRSRPRFGLEMVGSASLARQVSQACGDPDAVHGMISRAAPGAPAVLVELHELPLGTVVQGEVLLSVTQPEQGRLAPRPVATLVCGLGEGTPGSSLSGTLDRHYPPLRVLVISTLAHVQ